MIKRIYFWDGALEYCPRYNLKEDSGCRVVQVEAASGWQFNKAQLEYFSLPTISANYIIITNQPLALNFNLVVNNKDKILDVREKIYLFSRKKTKWLPIEDFTDRELRFAHNILKMYLAGCFEEENY